MNHLQPNPSTSRFMLHKLNLQVAKTLTSRLAFAMLSVCAVSGTVVHAADLTMDEYIHQLSSRPADPALGSDPDEAFADDSGVSKSLVRVRRPDTSGACLADNPVSMNDGKALVVVALAPSGAPQVNLILQYGIGGYKLSESDKAKLNTLARALNSDTLRRARFTVAGHADASGNSVANEKLSCARSLAARTYLIEQGVAPGRLSAYGFGSSQQRANSAPDAAENRRVEFRRADD